jgi:uncharacterized protein
MILYLGTSSLAKLYADEKYSDIVRGWVEQAEIVSTCRVAYTEMISALELKVRQNDLSNNDYELITERLAQDWPDFAVVDFDEREAGGFVKKYDLNRFAAIHLSAAKIIRKSYDDISLLFSSVDEKLCKAAVAEGLKVLYF